jgi:hypothetical protein
MAGEEVGLRMVLWGGDGVGEQVGPGDDLALGKG